jgi:tRNA A37 threonylcarbamoyladenosine dehydratase
MVLSMLMQCMREIMNELCRNKFEYLKDAIDSIDRTFDFIQVQTLIENFVATCNPPEIYRVFLECKLWNLEKRL